jgi:hypothetical protein
LREFLRRPKSCEYPVAGCSFGNDLAKGGFGLFVLTLLGERQSRLELSAGFGGFFCLPPLITAPPADTCDGHNGESDQGKPMAGPQLLQPLATNFFVNLSENIGHTRPPGQPVTHTSMNGR